jgi:hypothetical protein
MPRGHELCLASLPQMLNQETYQTKSAPIGANHVSLRNKTRGVSANLLEGSLVVSVTEPTKL